MESILSIAAEYIKKYGIPSCTVIALALFGALTVYGEQTYQKIQQAEKSYVKQLNFKKTVQTITDNQHEIAHAVLGSNVEKYHLRYCSAPSGSERESENFRLYIDALERYKKVTEFDDYPVIPCMNKPT